MTTRCSIDGWYQESGFPERDLWAEVLLRAAEEACWGPRYPEGRPGARRKEQRDTIEFCTAASGRWAERRAEVCELVDVDPDAYRRGVLRMLAHAEEIRATLGDAAAKSVQAQYGFARTLAMVRSGAACALAETAA